MQEAADTTLQQQLARHLVGTLAQLSEDERSRVRNDWKDTDGAVIETAASLDADLLQAVNDAVNTVVGRKTRLTVQTRPDLIAGARLRIGGHVWDASLAGQLESIQPADAEKTA